MNTKLRRWPVLAAVLLIALAAVPAIAYGLSNLGPSTPVQHDAGDKGVDRDYGSAWKSVNPTAPPSQEMVKEPAPIEGVEIRVAESFPPQYFAHVAFGLPNSCVEPGGYEVEREGKTIRIKVSVLRPSGDVICAMVYGTASYDIALGSDFQSGETYTVDVNGTKQTFVAQ
jgi:hypothetical protein